jgi:ribonuclease-3 family protein
MPENNIKICDMSTPSLAYLGDCVLELLVRERLTLSGISSSKNLNKEALRFVSAPAQAAAMKNILELLTEEESGYFRRGRNIGHTNTPKNATVAEYRTATGMETLFGFLHLSGRKERARELFALAFPFENENN